MGWLTTTMAALTDYPDRLVVICPQPPAPTAGDRNRRWRTWEPVVCLNGVLYFPYHRHRKDYDVNHGQVDGYRMVERIYDIGADKRVFVRFKVEPKGVSLKVYKVQADWDRACNGTDPRFPYPITVMVVNHDNTSYNVWDSEWRGVYPEPLTGEARPPIAKYGSPLATA